ncbi:MAG: hypothetical protein PUK59_07145 [Actinomycetaceae bacterium]|nr:hypothetical protein [Actinomycetaceae bacterium]MDY5854937.1 hypothetical protein [Arcanobacterium sp.]
MTSINIAAATARLFREVGNAATLSEPDARLLCEQAAELISRHVGSADVPGVILQLACVAVARDLHAASQAPGGVFSPFADGGAVRLARDPMKAAYPLLAPYVRGGFA